MKNEKSESVIISRLIILFSLCCVIYCPGALSDQLSVDTLKQELKNGGYVIYFRHASTTWMGVDKIEWPRERQRLLSEQGIASSKKIGAAFKLLGIPVTEVYASPFARCRDMAEIAFGVVTEKMELLGLLSDDEGTNARRDYLREQLSSAVEDGNRIIISHSSNIREVAGISLGEGDSVVLEPKGGSEFNVLGIIPVADW
jgi:phosphohistidine phosphatase SixA